ncbi:Phospholipase D1 [Coemansia erecta]|nr:Phospholipase D1 [Coemansia erecta]
MRQKTSWLLLLLFAAIQLISTSNTALASKQCRAQNILEACLAMQNKQYKQCAFDDWECKCHGQKKILVCYDNCPDSENRTLQEMQVQIFCAAVNGKEYNSELIDRMTRPARIVADDAGPPTMAPEQPKGAAPAPADKPQANKDDEGDEGAHRDKRRGGVGHGSNFSVVDDSGAASIVCKGFKSASAIAAFVAAASAWIIFG